MASPELKELQVADIWEHAAWRKICKEWNSCMKPNKILISISNVLVPTCGSNVTTAKIWNMENFCQFFPHQKQNNKYQILLLEITSLLCRGSNIWYKNQQCKVCAGTKFNGQIRRRTFARCMSIFCTSLLVSCTSIDCTPLAKFGSLKLTETYC